MLFKLTKDYFDGIDEEGNCFIIYNAILHFFYLKIPYTSILFLDSKNEFIEKSILQKSTIRNTNNIIEISNKKLKFKATWNSNSISNQHIENLFTYKNKNLIWNCHSPKASFQLSYNNRIYEGFGYAEQIQLPFFPWKLPIDELYWGRFVSQNNTLVWIVWNGKKPIKKVFWNQLFSTKIEINECSINFPEWKASLYFNEKRQIVSKKLSNISAKYPILKFIFKRSFLNSIESKYCSNATFVYDDISENGNTIFEKVIWNK